MKETCTKPEKQSEGSSSSKVRLSIRIGGTGPRYLIDQILRQQEESRKEQPVIICQLSQTGDPEEKENQS